MNNNIEIHPSAVIAEDVIIEDNVYIGPNCIIGFPAEDRNMFPNTPFSVHICSGTIITGNVTIDAGTIKTTYIGNDCFLMKSVHIGHDSIIGDKVTIAPHAIIGGHVEIMEGATLGMGCIIHQRQKIWHYCMVGMGTIVPRKLVIQPFSTYFGNPAKKIGTNTVAIERNEIDETTVASIQKLFDESR